MCSACHDSSRRCNRCSKDGDDPVRPCTAERPPALRRRRLTIERLRAPRRGQSPLTQPLVDRLPVIEPEEFKIFKLTKSQLLTNIYQSLRSMEKVGDSPVLEALRTTNGQSILLDETICPDVLFVSSASVSNCRRVLSNNSNLERLQQELVKFYTTRPNHFVALVCISGR